MKLNHDTKTAWILIPGVDPERISAGNKVKLEKSIILPPDYVVIMFVRDPVQRVLEIFEDMRLSVSKGVHKLLKGEISIPHQWEYAAGKTVHYLGKYEEIDEYWMQLRNIIALNDLPLRTRSAGNRPIDDEHRLKLTEYYQKDYDLYYR